MVEWIHLFETINNSTLQIYKQKKPEPNGPGFFNVNITALNYGDFLSVFQLPQ